MADRVYHRKIFVFLGENLREMNDLYVIVRLLICSMPANYGQYILALSSDMLAIFDASAYDKPSMPLNSLIVAIELARLSTLVASLIAHLD